MNIPELEQRFDVELPQSHLKDRPGVLLNAGARWSAAVWTAAEVAGPIELSEEEIDRGFEVGRRPVFVCGAHRSGTTLVRDLLDGHPSLAILPSEGTFLTNMEPRLRRLPYEHRLASMGREWLRRLVNPINRGPYWLLGRTSGRQSPYVSFARSLMAWWQVAEERFGEVATSWPLVAVALAYAHCTGGLSARSQVRRWGEKTPMNERFLDRLQSQFPEGKVIQVVRNPFAVYASRKEAEQYPGGSFRNARRALRDLDFSYRAAVEHSRPSASDRFLLVRYEELIESTHASVDRLAAFLGIKSLPVLMQPTVAGMPSTSNSSFVRDAVPGCIHPENEGRWASVLTYAERERLTAVVSEAAVPLGYRLPPIAPWRARLLRIAARVF